MKATAITDRIDVPGGGTRYRHRTNTRNAIQSLFLFRRFTMTVLIKDLSLDKELDRKEMSAVRGGLANQANGTNQVNNQSLFAPVSVANGSCFGSGFGSGPVNIQVDSYPTQTASNDSTSTNSQGGFPMMSWPA
jgi:hypothetical protein